MNVLATNCLILYCLQHMQNLTWNDTNQPALLQRPWLRFKGFLQELIFTDYKSNIRKFEIKLLGKFYLSFYLRYGKN